MSKTAKIRKPVDRRKAIRNVCAVVMGVTALNMSRRPARPGDTYTALFDWGCLVGAGICLAATWLWPRKPWEALHLAVLGGRTSEVRRIGGEDPSTLLASTSDGMTVLEAARATGDVFTEVALIRLKAPGANGVTEWGALLGRYMGQLCSRLAGASWVGEVEFDLWRAAAGGKPLSKQKDPSGFSRIDADTVEDLKFLANRAGGWFGWDEKRGRAAFISREAWRQKCAEYGRRRDGD